MALCGFDNTLGPFPESIDFVPIASMPAPEALDKIIRSYDEKQHSFSNG
jgi:hypothetical protein